MDFLGIILIDFPIIAISILFGLVTLWSIVFSLVILARIFLGKDKFLEKIKKTILSLPTPMISVWLVYAFIEMILFAGIGAFFMSIVSIPVYIVLKGSISLITRISKVHTLIKEWSGDFKAGYIMLCLVALAYFCWAVFVIIGSIQR